jgi:tryptophanyl-tRNA synthetase
LRIFSGIQPTGVIHLGNYLGAIKNWVDLQNNNDAEQIYCLVNMHAITVYQNPEMLRKATLLNAALLMACGIDEHKIYIQSQLSTHARLAWIFNCVARTGWLNRMTQFKDKSDANSSTGLYVYPNLMAADIFSFHATHVPVGEDQLQHLNLANDIGEKFNHDYGIDFFPYIKPIINETNARVMALREPTKKMSKSDEFDFNRINLTDDEKAITAKMKRAYSTTEPLPDNEDTLEHSPEAANLLKMFSGMTGIKLKFVVETYAGKQYSMIKKDLTEILIQKLIPISKEANLILKDEISLLDLLSKNAQRMKKISEPIVSEAERLVGFL